MEVIYSKHFIKQVQKSPRAVQKAFRLRLELFLRDPRNPLLRFHALQGELEGYFSINVTGDWRVLFRFLDHGRGIFLIEIGTHSQLYQ